LSAAGCATLGATSGGSKENAVALSLNEWTTCYFDRNGLWITFTASEETRYLHVSTEVQGELQDSAGAVYGRFSPGANTLQGIVPGEVYYIKASMDPPSVSLMALTTEPKAPPYQSIWKQEGAYMVALNQSGAAPAAVTAQTAPDEPTRLYEGDTLQGEMDIGAAFEWIAANVKSGGVYTIELGSSPPIASQILDYGGKKASVTLKAAGGGRQLSFASRSPSVALFTVKAGVTFTLEDGITIAGRETLTQTLVSVDGGEFVMSGGAIKDNKAGGIVVNGGAFTMSGGVIGGNDQYGVSVKGGAFTMNGGAISGNVSRGVSISGGTFTMSGGVISGNENTTGGGVYVSGGTFTMSGGEIIRNFASKGYGGSDGNGGGVFVKSVFTMDGGTISGNGADQTGGGVYVDAAGRFTMSGGKITGNSANSSGGVSVLVRGSFTMNNGEISRNEANRTGGGVDVRGGTFTMSGGKITGNSAGSGGGVYVGEGGTLSLETARGTSGGFTMTGGEISGNTAPVFPDISGSGRGGGVWADGAFTKTGGVIYGSDAPEGQANKAGELGHAVWTGNGILDSTARATRALDNTKKGPAGGWE
jgi:hypothetical protein